MSTTRINEPTEQSAKQVAIQLGGEVLLRDYFAAKAMQALVSDSHINATWRKYAEESYLLADAMIKAREAT